MDRTLKNLAAITMLLLLIQLSAAETIFQTIEKNYQDLDQQILLKTYAVFATDKLPPPIKGIDYRMVECGTALLLEIRQNWDILSETTRSELLDYLERPTGLDQTLNSPHGYFKLHFTYSGPDAVSGIGYVQDLADYFDTAWEYQVETLGFLAPPSDGTVGGDGRYDVYLRSLVPGLAGYTQVEDMGPEPWFDGISFIVVRSEFSGYGDPAGEMQTTSAHEFHHAVIAAYNFGHPSWWQEKCAVWMEDEVWPAVNSCYNLMDAYLDYPWLSLTTQNGMHEYGSFVWPRYLSENFGIPLILSIWEYAKWNSDPVYCVNQALGGIGTNFQDEFCFFETWNYITAGRDDGMHFSEAGNYPEVALLATHSSFPVTSSSSSNPPEALAANFIVFSNDDSYSSITINFDGNDAASWRAMLLKSFGGIYEWDEIFLGGGYSGSLDITDWSRYSEVVLIPVNVSTSGSATNFTYSATASGASLPPPTDLAATLWQNGIIPLSWDPATGGTGTLTGCWVYQSPEPGGPYFPLMEVTGTSYTDTVVNGVVYYYLVTANYLEGESRATNRVAAIAGGGSRVIDTLDYDNNAPSGWFGTTEGGRVCVFFTPPESCRVVELQYRFRDGGPVIAHLYDHQVSTIDAVWASGQLTAPSGGWLYVPVSDELVFVDSTFAVGCVMGSDGIHLSSNTLDNGRSYYWSGSEWVHYPGTIFIRAVVEYTIPTGVDQLLENIKTPDRFEILCYPNPFNSMVNIKIAGVRALSLTPLQVRIYDINGRAVCTFGGEGGEPITDYWSLTNQEDWLGEFDSQTSQITHFTWSPELTTPSGIYFIKAQMGNKSAVKKVIHLK